MAERGKKNIKWTLPENEVSCSGGGGTSTRRKKRSIASRAVDLRSWHYALKHLPTGIEVEGEVPEGNYSQKQMQQKRKELKISLWLKLQVKVAKHLRLPGW
jgi:hypothetical protein